MTAAIGAEAAAGAAGAGEGAAAAGASRASAAAPTASAPVGTARPSAGRPGAKPRSPSQLRASSTTRTRATKTTAARSSGPSKGKRSGVPAIISKPGRSGLTRGHGRHLLLAEFVVCVLITALSPLTDKHKAEPIGQVMKRNTAIAVLFLVLALVSSAGRGASRVAAAFGGLVTVALLVSDRDIFGVIAKRIGSPPAAGPAGPPGPGGAPPPSGEGGAPTQPAPPTWTDPNGGGFGFPNPVPPGQWWNPGPL